MPYRPRRQRDRLDVLSPQDHLELCLMVEPHRDPATRERLWALWQRHGARLIEQDGPQRWHLPIAALGPPPRQPID